MSYLSYMKMYNKGLMIRFMVLCITNAYYLTVCMFFCVQDCPSHKSKFELCNHFGGDFTVHLYYILCLSIN